jgi:hypothetical protein
MSSKVNYITLFLDTQSNSEDENESSELFSKPKRTIKNKRKSFFDNFTDSDYETSHDEFFINEQNFLFDFEEESTENKINKNRQLKLSQNLTNDFISIIKEENFEFGYKTRSEELLREQLKINELATRNWLNEIFIKYFKDQSVIIGIMRILSRFEPREIYPQGQTMAIAALAHSNDEIKELGIRAFENWPLPESLNILKNLDVSANWLKEYLEDVIQDLEEEL